MINTPQLDTGTTTHEMHKVSINAPDLSTARGVLADCTHHADQVVQAAAYSVAHLTDDAAERAEALELARIVGNDHVWVECWNCGGDGDLEGTCTCMEDCCACLEPEACDVCNGRGGWHA
ncbi:hypothetical protein O4H61_03465 [Roseovarius aestuarii]|nr:hypothetical protein [Roseovarius aestuarii]